MQPIGGPPLWATYLVAKRELIVVPIALGLAALLAFRALRSLRRAEPSPLQSLTLLPGWLVWLGAFALFYVGIAESLGGVSGFVGAAAPAFGWTFAPAFINVPLAPALFFDAGVLLIAALWILLTGRDEPDPDESDEAEDLADAAAPDEVART